MGANLNGFNAAEVEPARSFEPIPAGNYLAVITASETKETRKKDGSYLQLTFQIVDGEHKGRNLWARLNLDNKNPTAVTIAQGELSAICRAVGVMTPRDSAELHNVPLSIRVTQKVGDDGETRNEIRGYKTASGETPEVEEAPVQSKAVMQAKAAPKAPAARTSMPWKRK